MKYVNENESLFSTTGAKRKVRRRRNDDMGNSQARRFYEEGKLSKFKSLDIDFADELLAALDEAISLSDLKPLKSAGLHKLYGDRAGQWAMKVNGPWRICFKFRSGNAYDVEIVDYHKG